MSNRVVQIHKELLSEEFKTLPGRFICALIHLHYRDVAKFSRTHRLQRQSVYTWINEGYLPMETVAPFFANFFGVSVKLLNYYQCSIISQGKIEPYSKLVLPHKKLLGGYYDYVMEGKEPDASKIWNFYFKAAQEKYGI